MINEETEFKWWERLIRWFLLHNGWEIDPEPEMDEISKRGALGEWEPLKK